MEQQISRRRLVGILGGGVVGGMAGCIGDGPGEPGTVDDVDHDHDHDIIPDPSGDHDHGDEDDDADGETGGDDHPGSEGLVYAFSPDTASLVDPEAGEVLTEFDVSPGNRDWGDVGLTSDGTTLFAVDSALDQVVIVDTETRELRAQVDIGSDPVHAFAPVEGEVWAHADGEGTFYVIDTDTHDVTDTVEVGLEGTGHGKIAQVDEQSAYVTNTGDDGVHVVDLESRVRIETVRFDDHDGHSHSLGSGQSEDDVRLLHDDDDHGAGGTHYVVYSQQSDLVFVERFGGGADDDSHTHSAPGNSDGAHNLGDTPTDGARLLHDDDDHDHGDAETVIVDASSQTVVGTVDVGGSLFISPDGDLVAVVDGDDIHFVDATDSHGGIEGSVTLDGAQPNAVHFDGEGHALTTNPHSGDVSVIDLDSFEERKRIDLSGDHLEDIPVSAGDETLVTAGDRTVAVIDRAAFELEREIDVPTDVDGLAHVE